MDETNLELAEGIKRNLNELIDKRGNTKLIPALVIVQRFIFEIEELKAQAEAIEKFKDEYQYNWEGEDAT